ncbi:MAG: response regulator [Desulfuromonadaceae bacterium]|nr:response regulator [Desulfuromonadaceae bacterium]
MKTKKLLVVDDTPENLAILYKTLRNDYEVIGAGSGREALRLVPTTHPDLILLDVMMPEMSGFEVCRILKAQDSTRGIPIIFLTALTDEADEARGFEVGAVDYITKPFKPAILRHRVSTHLELKYQRDELARKNDELETALTRVKELSGLLPICMMCKKIRDDTGYWNQLETYITLHSEVLFSHCICPECFEVEMQKVQEDIQAVEVE